MSTNLRDVSQILILGLVWPVTSQLPTVRELIAHQKGLNRYKQAT